MRTGRHLDPGAVRGVRRQGYRHGRRTGPLPLRPAGAESPAVTGNYITVWRKNDAGQWKGIVDIGNPD
jgi:hypothetical protein